MPLAEVAGKLKCVDPEAGIIQEAQDDGHQLWRQIKGWRMTDRKKKDKKECGR